MIMKKSEKLEISKILKFRSFTHKVPHQFDIMAQFGHETHLVIETQTSWMVEEEGR